MGSDYNMCRDAYFTCMDQFCGTASDDYRRCICSERLDKIRERERQLKQTSDQLQDFAALNIEVITKTGKEVAAMLTATAGEYEASRKDTSDASKELSGITAVLSGAKAQASATSTGGTLDIAGDVSRLWSTGDFIGGADIANLEGSKLYEQVHAQCFEITAEACPRQATRNMVVAAYGMYIEQDCNTISAQLDSRRTQAQGAVRQAEWATGAARLETYNVHNSATIDACIAQVRIDITNPAACGVGYVHCLDATGLYLNLQTGEPIYTPNLYKLETQISLDGNVLSNSQNASYVSLLERKKESARRGLDTCRDLSDSVWEEFKLQALVEIYQGQQKRVRQVKDECIHVLNECFDEQLANLKDFTNQSEQFLMGHRIELSETLCQNQLDTCTNLYGGGVRGRTSLT